MSTLYLTVNKLAPDYENVEVGIADQFLIRTICEARAAARAAVGPQARVPKMGMEGTV